MSNKQTGNHGCVNCEFTEHIQLTILFPEEVGPCARSVILPCLTCRQPEHNHSLDEVLQQWTQERIRVDWEAATEPVPNWLVLAYSDDAGIDT